MQAPATSTDIRGQLLFLGTGTSVGVPVIGCGCAVCTSPDPRNHRTRCAVAVGLPEGNLLIDTPPDLRTQLLREGLGLVHATLFTHAHADHVFGLDDLRLFPYYLQRKLPIFCEEVVEGRLRRSFDYVFQNEINGFPAGSIPQLEIHRITTEPFELLGARIVPVPLFHGALRVLGYRIGKVAYCTDVNRIPDESWDLLRDLDVLILDCLRPRPHPTHFSLAEAVEAARRIAARQTWFTHISHSLDHQATNQALPEGMALAYDGLRIPLS